VALSGGADSTALVAVLAEMRDRGALAGVEALHVDHGLREGSARDAEACRATCAALGVPCRAVRVTVPPGNVQAEARRVRYAELRRAARESRATRIATGHTQDDQAETFLLRLLRGAGARGLGAIPPRRGAIVRPLIDRSRLEVERYLRERGLGWVDDPTNATARYLRNRVRSEALPVLRRLSPRAVPALARAADLLRDDDRALAARASRLVISGSASVEVLRRRPVAVRRRVVRRLWKDATGSRADLSARHVEAVVRLVSRAAPGRVRLPGGREARVGKGTLTIGPVPSPGPSGAVPVPPTRIDAPGTHRLPDGRSLRVDEGAEAAWPLWWRSRLPGDRFRPAGGRGSKKLSDWLIDRKVPREERERLLLLADDRGWVLWIPDLEARSERPSVTARLQGRPPEEPRAGG
jgi:tRNA(Ile)-lysidine synthase